MALSNIISEQQKYRKDLAAYRTSLQGYNDLKARIDAGTAGADEVLGKKPVQPKAPSLTGADVQLAKGVAIDPMAEPEEPGILQRMLNKGY